MKGSDNNIKRSMEAKDNDHSKTVEELKEKI